jgi:hypothetical protein
LESLLKKHLIRVSNLAYLLFSQDSKLDSESGMKKALNHGDKKARIGEPTVCVEGQIRAGGFVERPHPLVKETNPLERS